MLSSPVGHYLTMHSGLVSTALFTSVCVAMCESVVNDEVDEPVMVFCITPASRG